MKFTIVILFDSSTCVVILQRISRYSRYSYMILPHLCYSCTEAIAIQDLLLSNDNRIIRDGTQKLLKLTSKRVWTSLGFQDPPWDTIKKSRARHRKRHRFYGLQPSCRVVQWWDDAKQTPTIIETDGAYPTTLNIQIRCQSIYNTQHKPVAAAFKGIQTKCI